MVQPVSNSQRRSRSRRSSTFRSRSKIRRLCNGVQKLDDRRLLMADFALVVTNGEDFGEGSFREAVEIASGDSSVDKIVIEGSVDLISVDSAVEFTGTQDLHIQGNGATLRASDTFTGDGVFISSAAADLSISRLTVDGDFEEGETAANGIFVPVPAEATGTLHVSLDRVRLINSGLFGLHIDDQLPEPDDEENLAGFDSDASIALRMKRSTVENNGIGALDYDGVRVDDGGDGSIFAHIRNTHIDGNGGDGLELDERGDGGVTMHVKDSTFDANGFFDEEDLDDGLDVDEAGAGGIRAFLSDVSLIGNFDEGLDLDEEDDGGAYVSLKGVRANSNLDEGIKVSEEDAGDVRAMLKDVVSEGNGDDGIELEEEDEGSLYLFARDVRADSNGDSGIQLEESGDGSLVALLKDVRVRGNAGNGAQLAESGNGNLFARVADSVFAVNGEFGIQAEQEDDGFGLLLLNDVQLHSNTLGDVDANGVRARGD